MNNTERIKGLIAINIAAVIFGSAALYGKLDVSPVWIVAMRGIFASVTLLIAGALRKEIQSPGKQTGKLLLTGGILALHWLTFFYSVQVSGIAIATLTFAAFPLFSLLLESFLQRKRVKFAGIAACIMIILAVALLVDIDSSSYIVLGAVSGLLSALLFAAFGVVSKALTRKLTTISVSFYQNAIVFLILLPFLPFLHPIPDDAIEWVYLAILGVITTALMHQLYLYALKRLTASTCSGFVALEPVYAILFAALFFSEPVTFTVAVSGILILAASFLILNL